MDDESLTETELLQSPICVVCSEHRWPAKRRIPKQVDFRYDDFLTPAPEAVPDYMNLVRTACLRDGGFEPKLLPIGNTFDSLISMVAAGRGVVMFPEIGLRNLHLPAAGALGVFSFIDSCRTSINVCIVEDPWVYTP